MLLSRNPSNRVEESLDFHEGPLDGAIENESIVLCTVAQPELRVLGLRRDVAATVTSAHRQNEQSCLEYQCSQRHDLPVGSRSARPPSDFSWRKCRAR
jgi:hypothetical protein